MALYKNSLPNILANDLISICLMGVILVWLAFTVVNSIAQFYWRSMASKSLLKE